MAYALAPRYQPRQFDDERDASVSGTYQRSMPANTYMLPRADARFSTGDTSYAEGFRSSGMDAQSYLESISKMRGYVPPQRMKGEYKDHETSAPTLQGPSVLLSSLRGLSAAGLR